MKLKRKVLFEKIKKKYYGKTLDELTNFLFEIRGEKNFFKKEVYISPRFYNEIILPFSNNMYFSFTAEWQDAVKRKSELKGMDFKCRILFFDTYIFIDYNDLNQNNKIYWFYEY
jgi:hypothetical protein